MCLFVEGDQRRRRPPKPLPKPLLGFDVVVDGFVMRELPAPEPVAFIDADGFFEKPDCESLVDWGIVPWFVWNDCCAATRVAPKPPEPTSTEPRTYGGG